MNKAKVKSIAKWILPSGLLFIHVFFIRKLYAYNLQIALHWGCYLLLFLYLAGIGEVKAVFLEFRRSIGKLDFYVKAFIVFCITFVSVMIMVYYFSKDINMMFPLWQPFSIKGLVVWGFAYVFLQPLVDNIIYHKWMMRDGDGTGISKGAAFVVVMLRTFVETGIIIYSKDSEIPKEGFLALACWAAMGIFACSYMLFKNVALTYTSEVLYRIALVMTVLIGMTQFYIPQI